MEEASAAADELGLLDLVSDGNPTEKPLNQTNPSNKNPNSLRFDELLDGAISGLSPPAKNSPPSDEDEEEEEELEWISNKDAFPSLETSFAVITTSTSPVSVLVPAPSFKVPVKARSKLNRKRRRIFAPMEAPPPPPAMAAMKGGRRICQHCEADETPQWRMGPEGPKTLCNACGVRFKKGRLYPEYRPANSPTFAAGVHSNSTRKIMEMRMGRGRGGGGKRGRPRVHIL